MLPYWLLGRSMCCTLKPKHIVAHAEKVPYLGAAAAQDLFLGAIIKVTNQQCLQEDIIMLHVHVHAHAPH